MFYGMFMGMLMGLVVLGGDFAILMRQAFLSSTRKKAESQRAAAKSLVGGPFAAGCGPLWRGPPRAEWV